MRSEALCEALRQSKAEKRVRRKRRYQKLYMRKRRKRLKAERAIIEPSHPTLSREEILAVEEAAEYARVRDSAHLFVLQTSPQSAIQPAVVLQPAEAEQREQRVAAHIEELKSLKYGPLQPDQKISVPAPFDYPNGIIR